MGRLRGKVAFMTGAMGGIGHETCVRYLDQGASVIAVDLNPEVHTLDDASGRRLSL